MTRMILIILSVALGLARFVVPVRGLQKKDVYKDMAHLWVGGLFGGAVASGSGLCWELALGLTLLEAIAFVVRR